MSLRSAARWAAGVGGLGLVAVAAAQPPAGPIQPASYTPTADVTQQVPAPKPADGAAALPQALTDARAAYAKVIDYTCHLVRQERVSGTLRPEQTAELRVRTKPLAVNVKVISPKAAAGEETSYITGRHVGKVRHRGAGPEGGKAGFRTLAKDDPKALADTRHPVTEVGLQAVLDRVDKVVQTEKRLNHPVQVLTSGATIGGKPATKFEVFADHPHAHRYAARVVVYFDAATKLPVRYEAYDSPKGAASAGDVLEVINFVGLRTNVGLADGAFER